LRMLRSTVFGGEIWHRCANMTPLRLRTPYWRRRGSVYL
jgi:hypothetical protein